MRRQHYAGNAVPLPKIINEGGSSIGGGTGNTKKIHFATGLGDGNVQTQGLRGGNSNNNSQEQRPKKRASAGDELDIGPMEDDADLIESNARKIRERNYLKHNQGNLGDDGELLDYLRAAADRRAAARRDDPIGHTEKGVGGSAGGPSVSSDGPWQLSVIMLLGIIGVLVGLFIHFSTDPSGQPYIRSRMKKTKMLSRPSYRKKTDEWSEDEETMDDTNYRGDNEGVGGNNSSNGGTIAKKRMHIPASPVAPNDPTARLYYPLNTGDSFRQQESRFRKSAQQQMNVDGGSSIGGNMGRTSFQSPSRPSMPTITSGNINNKGKKSPAMGRGVFATPTITPSSTSSNHRNMAKAQSSLAPPLPFGNDSNSELGSGLEGFEHTTNAENKHDNYSPAGSNIPGSTNASPMETPQYTPAITGLPIVKPMGTFTPTESFGSLPFALEEDSSVSSAPPDSANVMGNHLTSTAPDSSQYGRTRELEKSLSSRSNAYESPDRSGFPSIHENGPAPESDMSYHDVMASPRHNTATLDSGGFSELPTPRVDHTRGKRELKNMLLANGKSPADFQLPSITPPPFHSSKEQSASNDNGSNTTDSSHSDTGDAAAKYATMFPNLPLVPNLNNSNSETSEMTRTDSFHVDAPRSVLLEELQLVRMESGVSGPKWRTKYEMEQPDETQHHTNEVPDHQFAPSSDDWRFRSGGQSYHHPMFGTENNGSWYESPDSESMQKQMQENENMEKLREASSHMDPADDPRNSIQHVRKDLTVSSDASSSLSSKITFSELKLKDIIGGGGFGQVWRATWKGTPVAVKVLTGSAQAELVPKSVLEEFIAEINLVSGMRHPNICLFMGACLDPPNRAIITELCENGSLWDALRSPLGGPYRVADGRTREAWPQALYDSMTAPPIAFGNNDGSTNLPPLVPAGNWPWILVKRVAAGAARGMTYLHSGNPPVLHRDLKSANILLDESYTAKLADFGLSRLKAVRSGMTGNCGTVQWMAPEVLCSEEYAEPADVFSFGIILWEMLSRECPYEGMTPIQCALSVLNENNRPEIPEWCPQSFRALIKNCVERDPKLRPSFPQILAALDAMP